MLRFGTDYTEHSASRVCPACGEPADAATGPHAPTPGAFIICVYCASLGVFDDELAIQILTRDARDALPPRTPSSAELHPRPGTNPSFLPGHSSRPQGRVHMTPLPLRSLHEALQHARTQRRNDDFRFHVLFKNSEEGTRNACVFLASLITVVQGITPSSMGPEYPMDLTLNAGDDPLWDTAPSSLQEMSPKTLKQYIRTRLSWLAGKANISAVVLALLRHDKLEVVGEGTPNEQMAHWSPFGSGPVPRSGHILIARFCTCGGVTVDFDNVPRSSLALPTDPGEKMEDALMDVLLRAHVSKQENSDEMPN